MRPLPDLETRCPRTSWVQRPVRADWLAAPRLDQHGVEIDCEVALVAVEALRLGLASVAHVLVLDRDAPVLGDPMAGAHAATSIGARFEILADDLPQRCDLLVDGGRASSSGRRAVTQCSKLVSCSMTVGIAVAFFVGITPVEIEPGLD